MPKLNLTALALLLAFSLASFGALDGGVGAGGTGAQYSHTSGIYYIRLFNP